MKDVKKCKVWFCTRSTNLSSQGYCYKHQRQKDRTGDPLAGVDAIALNRMALRMMRLCRQLLDTAVWVDHNDIAHCRVCDSHSAPHDRIMHKPGCVVVEAREMILETENGV